MKYKFVLVLLCLVSSFAFTQESDVDNLFSDSKDIVTQENANNNSSDLTTAFTNAPKLQFSGSFSATGGLGIGYTQWPDLSEPLKYYDGSAGATAATTLVMKAQPSSALSVYGDVSTSLDTMSSAPTYSWSDLHIGSLYFDYYGIPNMGIRGGQFATAWGHGRIFTATNLMQDSASSVNLRVSLPLVLQGLSLFILANKDYFTSTPTVYEYAYAGMVDHIIGPLRITGAMRYQKKEGLGILFSVQGTILGVDVFADTVIRYIDTFQQPIIVGGFFKEFSHTRLYGEYQYDGSNLNAQDHSIGLVFLQKRLVSQPLDAGIKWEHTFYDNSGQLIPGFTWSGLPNITLQVALPITYGPENSRYLTNNSDPGKRRIVLAIAAKIEGSF